MDMEAQQILPDHSNYSFTFIDLFAGIGGIRLALDELGGTCVFSSEINQHCRTTYQVNFGELPHGDITQIPTNQIPDHDILTAGFPCQPFSISGKQDGFNDTRGTLFFYVAQIAKEKRPSILLLENVKHLIHHDKGRTLKVILRALEEIGYHVTWKVLNAKDFGLAQNRERIIIIASKKGYFDFNTITTHSQQWVIRDILDIDGEFEYLDESEYTILDKSLWKRQPSGLIFCGYRNKAIRKAGVRKNTLHLSRVHKQPNRIYHIDGTHPTIPSQETSGRFWIYDGQLVRKLTINECFRLMGFPDDYQKNSTKGELYKQIGNSVPVNMMQAVANEVLKHLFDNQPVSKDFIAPMKQLPLFANEMDS